MSEFKILEPAGGFKVLEPAKPPSIKILETAPELLRLKLSTFNLWTLINTLV